MPNLNEARGRSLRENLIMGKDFTIRLFCKNKKSWVFAILAGFIIVRMWMVSLERSNYRLLGFTIFLMCIAFYIFWRQRCRRRPHTFEGGGDLSLSMTNDRWRTLTQAPQGVPGSVRATFKYFDYIPEQEQKEDYKDEGGEADGRAWAQVQEGDCSICLCEYTVGVPLCQLPCGHVFHKPCIEAWIDTHTLCPMCKAELCSTPNSEEVPEVPTTEQQISIIIEEEGQI